MSMTFMGERQRRHGEPRDQNDHGGDARKLLLRAHALALSQVGSAAKQFPLIGPAVQFGNFGAQKIRCTSRAWSMLSPGGRCHRLERVIRDRYLG